MHKIKIVGAVFFAASAFSATAASPASAVWLIGGEELTSGATAALATTAKVSTASTFTIFPTMGSKIQISCSGSLLHGEAPEITGTETLRAKSLTFEGCATTEPTTRCTLEKSTIKTVPVVAKPTPGPEYPDDRITFSPQTKKTFANIPFSETNSCAYTGEEPLTGGVTLNAPNLQEELGEQPLEALGSDENNSLETVGSKVFITTGKGLLKRITGGLWAFTQWLTHSPAEVDISVKEGSAPVETKVVFTSIKPLGEVTIASDPTTSGAAEWAIGKVEATSCVKGYKLPTDGSSCGVWVKFSVGAKKEPETSTGDLIVNGVEVTLHASVIK
jgi:hypothetical protein